MMNFDAEVSQLIGDLHAPEPQRNGTLVRLVGMRLETRGLMAPLGACCEVLGQFGHRVEAEVVGFNDDTRAFPSIPARHDVARRIDCAYLAELVMTHRLDEAEAHEVAYDLAYRLAKTAYRL